MGQEQPGPSGAPTQPPPGYPAAGAWGVPPPQGAYPPQPQYGAPPAYPQQYGVPPGQPQYAYGPPPGQPYGARPPPGQPYGAAPPPYGAAPQRPGAPKPPGPPPAGNFDAYDQEAAQAAAYAAAFAETTIRKQFVRKVFLIVFCQLAFTIGVAATFIFVEPVRAYVQPGASGQWVFYVSWVLALVMLIALMCSTRVRRKHPWNLAALFAFTLVQSVLVGCICAYWNTSVVLEAFAVTGAAVAGLTLAAVFGKFDITKKGHILAMASMVVFFVLLVTIIVGFFYVNKWWYLAISVVVALLFSAYLVYDIQLVMGKGAVAISPDEYIFASVQIYMDIIILFLQFLNIIGIAQS